jgi:hypothetical protein
MKKTLLLLLVPAVLVGSFSSCKKKGCTDPSATNYNEEAKKDDESCTYVPIISLNGPAQITIELGDTYEELGATATNKDGSTVNVVIEASSDEVNTAVTGTYTITYSATNDYGKSSVTRTVNVVVGSSSWVGSWVVTDDCSNTRFPLHANPEISLSGGNGLLIENKFDYLSVIFGTATATIDNEVITVPEQTYSNNGVTIIFSGTGTMNATGTSFTINYSYNNTTPLIGGSGTCTATYEKQ